MLSSCHCQFWRERIGPFKKNELDNRIFYSSTMYDLFFFPFLPFSPFFSPSSPFFSLLPSSPFLFFFGKNFQSLNASGSSFPHRPPIFLLLRDDPSQRPSLVIRSNCLLLKVNVRKITNDLASEFWKVCFF